MSENAEPTKVSGDVQVTHTTATAENAAAVMEALLSEFVDVAAAFPSIRINKRMGALVRIYLPPLVSDS